VSREDRSDAAAAACIVALTLLAYLPAFTAGFVWDDDRWLTENPAVVGDGSWLDLWTGVERLQYYPLLYTVFRLEYRLWGLEPFGYHAVNVLLHALNAVLLALILRRLRVPGAWWVGAVFAVHPVHVESVAWITELKNVLSGALALGAALLFLQHDEHRRRRAFLLALAAFTAALCAKTAVAPLPVVLAALLVWKHGKLTVDGARRVAPFLAVAAALAAVTVRLESGMVTAMDFDFELSPVQRIARAARILLFYPSKLLVPWPTMFHYPRWDLDGGVGTLLAPLAAVLALAAAAVVLWRRGHRGAVLAAASYAALIAPVLGLFEIYYFRYSFVADHFQYLAAAGILILPVEAARRLGRRLPSPRMARNVAAAAVLALAALTFAQARAYRDWPTLLRDTLAKNPGSWFARHGLGLWLLDHGEPEQALAQIEEALRAKPRSAESHVARGMARARLGDIEGALRDFDRAVELDPLYPDARLQRGMHRVTAGLPEPALEDLSAFIGPGAAHPLALLMRGRALRQLQRFPEALADLDRAVEIGPSAPAYVERGLVLGQTGREDAALEDAGRALRLDPAHAPAWALRGVLWHRRGDEERACADWRRACELGDCSRYDRRCR
jgi:tetratricopeptide (TPR) repeat protein